MTMSSWDYGRDLRVQHLLPSTYGMNCPVCGLKTSEAVINLHLDKGCPPFKKQKTSNEPSTTDALPQHVPSPPSSSPSHQPRNIPGTGQTNSANVSKNESSKSSSQASQPLAERMRPQSLDDYVGQDHLVGPTGILQSLLKSKNIPSMILWGPSGVGKTTFARILAKQVKARVVELSATSSGSGDVKKLADEAKSELRLTGRRTVLFLDEIHRFNRAQQDSLLPSVERGTLILIGATTENPSFKLQGALLSRCRVFTLNKLELLEVRTVLDRALKQAADYGEFERSRIESLGDEELSFIASVADGDGRAALNMLEIVLNLTNAPTLENIKKSLKHVGIHDQQGDMHYDLISAFHKSVRGSNADAALYYLGRMLRGGEDPLYVARRMIRISSEDVGLADDSCLPFAVATHTAVQQVGMPEADVILAHCAVKLAKAPKSVEVYKALGALKADMDASVEIASAPVPLHLRNAPTKLMAQLGYSDGYKYNPAFIGPVRQDYLPSMGAENWLGRWTPDQVDDKT